MKLRNYLVLSLCLLALSGCSSSPQETTAAFAETAAVEETSSEAAMEAVQETAAQTASEVSPETTASAAAKAVQQTTAAATKAVVQTTAAAATAAAQAESKTVSQSSVDLKSLTDMVGKSDSEVTALLGQGEEVRNEAGLILDRTYALSILGENANVSLTFNLYQEGSNILEQAVISLGQSDIKEYAKTLTQLFGEPTETYEKSYFFASGSKTLVLADPYGDGAYIEISLGE